MITTTPRPGTVPQPSQIIAAPVLPSATRHTAMTGTGTAADIAARTANRRVKITGMAKAADIATHGIACAVGLIPPCTHCGRRTRQTTLHRTHCPVRTATEPEPETCSDCGRAARKILDHARDCVIRDGHDA